MTNHNDDISLPLPPGRPSPPSEVNNAWSTVILSPLFVLFLLPLIMYVASLPALPLMEPDETRYALIPQYMNLTGDYVTPHLKGVAYLEKPPLAYWVTASFFKVFGENAFAARLFAGICAWGCILLAFNMGAFLYGRRVGIYNAAVLSVSLLPFALGRINILDMPLTFFLCLAIWCGYRFFTPLRREAGPVPTKRIVDRSSDDVKGDIEGRGGEASVPLRKGAFGDVGNRKWRDLFYAACALAFLTKGVIGAIFPPTVIVLWLLWSRRWRDIGRLLSLRGVLIFSLPVGLWLVMVQRANPDFFWFFFIHEHFLRYTTKIHERVEPFWYYLPVILLGITPWWAYLVPAWAGWRRTRKTASGQYGVDEAVPSDTPGPDTGGHQPTRMFSREESRLFIVWSGFILLFFSLSSSKLASYIAPVVLPFAVILGRLFQCYDSFPAGREAGEGIVGPADGMGTDKLPSWTLVPAVLLSLSLGAVVFVPLFVPEYRELGPPRGNWLWLSLPLLAAAAILFIPERIRRQGKRGWFASVYLLFALYLLSLLPSLSHYLTPGKSALDVVRAVREHVPAGAVLYQYRLTMYGLDFYTGRKTPIVEDLGELKFGADRISPRERAELFPTEEEFIRAVGSCRRGAETGEKPLRVSPPADGPESRSIGRVALPPSEKQTPARQERDDYQARGASFAKESLSGCVSFAVTEGKSNVTTLRRSFPEARMVWNNSKFYLLALPG